MQKKQLFYLVAIIALFSLQSCVTNYAVANPIPYNKNTNVNRVILKDPINHSVQKSKMSLDESLAKLEKVAGENTKENILNTKMKSLIEEAESYLGTPYRYGGTTRKGIDCSAFVLSVYNSSMGINLPRVAASQAREGERVSKAELKVGDIVFFSLGRNIGHVGIVHDIDENGEVRFIHASTSRGVMVSSLNNRYWGPRFRFAKRIVTEDFLSSSNVSAYANN